jgi:hypothetical protein
MRWSSGDSSSDRSAGGMRGGRRVSRLETRTGSGPNGRLPATSRRAWFREDVGPMIDGAARACSGDIRRCPDDAGLRVQGGAGGALTSLAARRLHELREPEVDDLGMAVLRHHHVGGFQVSMDHPALVRSESSRLRRHLERSVPGKPPLEKAVGQPRPRWPGW